MNHFTRGQTERNCIVNEAVLRIMENLVEMSLKNRYPEVLIALVTSFYMNDDDKVFKSQTNESALFENADRHEFHQNLYMMQLVYQCFRKFTLVNKKFFGKIDQTKMVMENLKKEVEYCTNWLEDSSVLQNPAAHNRARFRLSCACIALMSLGIVGYDVRKHISGIMGETSTKTLDRSFEFELFYLPSVENLR